MEYQNNVHSPHLHSKLQRIHWCEINSSPLGKIDTQLFFPSPSPFPPNTFFSVGGAIYTQSNIVINGSVFNENVAYESTGGAIHATDAEIVVVDFCEFTRNNASASGGAVFATESSIKFNNCKFIRNYAIKASGNFHILLTIFISIIILLFLVHLLNLI